MVPPITVPTVPNCDTQSMFIPSMICLKKNGTWTFNTLAPINKERAMTTRALKEMLFAGHRYFNRSLRINLSETSSVSFLLDSVDLAFL
ncbi:hypothetical protein WICPIJ_002207 [Wickerhamomyces pijperi]|uniref:Uncharacterized protein n=1 Tax=Wickerhamomyces pijperi TaxID=599730 RepID=A0A9P8TQ10_WICPI|nr:hypothetical protein WICPIJ_002207 [Wickerhamomyces pijperi]